MTRPSAATRTSSTPAQLTSSAGALLQTPLHLVAAAGHGMCVKALLDAGSDPSAKNMASKTALDLAEEGRHMGALRMMRLVLERREANGSNGAAHRRAK